MRTTTFSILFIGILLSVWACTPNRGCNELTADNFDQAAEEDDGTCIPSRDKMIGNFTYTRVWTDVILEVDSADAGAFVITERNTADNAFILNLDAGQHILKGDITAFNFTIEPFEEEDTFSYGGFTADIIRNFTSQGGTWLESDSVDMTFSVSTRIPIEWDNGNPPQLITVPQTYNYYCTKVP